MSKGTFFGGRRGRSSDVNVINPAFRRSTTRRAKVAFLVTLCSGWLLAAVVASQVVSNGVLAAFVGLVVAFACAFVVGVAVLVWPVLRVVWHWLAESIVGLVLAGAVLAVGQVVHGLVAVAIVAASVGGLFVWSPLRHRISAVLWCAVSRHRLRVCFAEFLPTDRSGSLPFILLARPTPVGERVWVWLRPGLAGGEFDDTRLAKMAVTCWARSVQVCPGGKGKYAAYLQFDIKRRNSFDQPIPSPLTEAVSSFLGRIPGRSRGVSAAMSGADVTALDLTDVPAQAVNTNTAGPRPTARADKPARKDTPAPVVAGAGEQDDVTDWI